MRFSEDYRFSPFLLEWSPHKAFFPTEPVHRILLRCYARYGDCTGKVRGDLQPREMIAELKGRIEAAH